MRRQTKILLGSGMLAVLIVAGFLISQQLRQDDGPDRFEVVATVNGEPITYGELLQSMDGGQGQMRAALERSVVVKVQQLEARRQGLVGDIGYRASLSELKRVNDARREQVKKGGVVYGPITYDEKRFLDERLRELREGLQARLTVSDEEVEQYYADNKRRFSLGESRTVAAISAVAEDPAGAARLEAAGAKLTELEQRMVAGATFDAIYDEVRRGGNDLLTAGERSFDYRTIRTDSLTSPALAQAVSELDAGEVTGIVADARSVGIYRCVTKKSLGYSPIEQVRPSIVGDLRARKYDAQVERWRADADVEIAQRGVDLGLSAYGDAG